MTSKPDDLEAVRQIVAALSGFEAGDQERIIRWAREKIGLSTHTELQPPAGRGPTPPAGDEGGKARDIRSFVATKDPKSDNQYAAAVAYYFKFEAPESERKESITAEDLQDATRKTGRNRFRAPAQTLVNAHNQGYFDRGDRGHYALNTVGENLVAMALPQGAAKPAPIRKKRAAAKKKR